MRLKGVMSGGRFVHLGDGRAATELQILLQGHRQPPDLGEWLEIIPWVDGDDADVE